MGLLKEHVPFAKVVHYTKLLTQIPAQRQITNDQRSILTDQLGTECIISGRGFKSFGTGKLYSFFIFHNQIILLPCSGDWSLDQEEVTYFSQLKEFELNEGNLYGSALRVTKVANFIRLKLLFSSSNPNLQINIVLPNKKQQNQLLRELPIILDAIVSQRRNQELLKGPIQKDAPQDSQTLQTQILLGPTKGDKENFVERVGSVLLWDIENLPLKTKISLQKDEDVKNIITLLANYAPLKAGVCAFAASMSTVNRQKVQEISPLIQAIQVNPGKDAADKELIERGLELISQHNPKHVVILSSDHVFSSLKDNFIRSNVIPVIVHKGNPSQSWASAGFPVVGENLNDFSKRINCQYSGCKRSFSTENGMDQHFKVKHPSTNSVKCKFETCNSKFSTDQAMNQHFSAKHSNKV